MRLRAWLFLAVGLLVQAAPPPAYSSARRKLDIIESDRAPAGATYIFTKAEIEAWAAVEIPTIVPEGFRDARVELSTGSAVGRALIDFLRMRHAKGAETNWFIDRLLEGERPVAVTVEVQSGNGMCTVNLKRVEISGIAATGSVLDFLVRNFFLSLYPEAKINQPFRMAHHVEAITLRPQGVYVKIGGNAMRK